MHTTNTFPVFHIIQVYSGITRGRVLNGELLYIFWSIFPVFHSQYWREGERLEDWVHDQVALEGAQSWLTEGAQSWLTEVLKVDSVIEA